MSAVIDKDFIYLDTELKTQQEVFAFLAKVMVEAQKGFNEEKLIEGFYAREKEYSTAMNEGIAIPHCRIPEIKEATVIVVRNKYEIQWTQKEPVHIVFALLIPQSNENQIHIKILAQVAQLIMEDDFIDVVKASSDAETIYSYMQIINDLMK